MAYQHASQLTNFATELSRGSLHHHLAPQSACVCRGRREEPHADTSETLLHRSPDLIPNSSRSVSAPLLLEDVVHHRPLVSLESPVSEHDVEVAKDRLSFLSEIALGRHVDGCLVHDAEVVQDLVLLHAVHPIQQHAL